MNIKNLQISHFRNITSLDIELGPKFNIFYGHNGSGKTSMLEAIYYLGLGRSFRSSQSNRIIQHNAQSFSIFIKLTEDDVITPIGLERNVDGLRRIKVDGECLQTLAPLARRLPIQFLSTESHRYFTEGPKLRRQYLDWGVFHVKHAFYEEWQQLQNALKQRNACLKARADKSEIMAWNIELIKLSNLVHQYRTEYVSSIEGIIQEMLVRLLPEYALTIQYSRGWPDQPLEEALANSLSRDCQLGYTQFGTHRADFQLYLNDVPVQDALSQGQLKLASYGLYLAQGALMQEQFGKSPIYLIDDLPSDLDLSKRKCITEQLSRLNSQVFVTGIIQTDLADLLSLPNSRAFHVKHGHCFEDTKSIQSGIPAMHESVH